MVAIHNSVSLNLVKDELDATLSQAESALEHFTEERANPEYVETFHDSFGQVKGICQMIELPGAQILAEDLVNVAQSFKDNIAGATDSKLGAVGHAIMILGRYLEYVQVKKQSLPMLLVPTINGVRQQFQKAPLYDSDFFNINLDVERSNPPALLDSAADVDLLKRLRNTYQVGFLALLKNAQSETGYKVMRRAVHRMDRLNKDPKNYLWWSAQGLLQQMHNGVLELSPSRKKLLAGLDRVLKAGVTGVDNKDMVTGLTKDCLMNVAMGNLRKGVSGELINNFELQKLGLVGVDVFAESEIMSGPGGSVIKTVAAALRDELVQVKISFEAACNGGESGFDGVAEAMNKVGNTLIMLGLTKESQDIMESSVEILQWNSDDINAQSEEFHALVDELLVVENSVAALERKFTSAEGIAEGDKETKLSLYQLDSARVSLVVESRSGLSLLKRAVSSFIDSNWDKAHLNNIPESLASVAGGLTFLELHRAEAILQAAIRYTEDHLLNEKADNPTIDEMDTFADAISCIDYYLESMEENKPIGDSILEVGEQSMAGLGYSVS